MSEVVKILLEEAEIPKSWYNIQADLPHPLAPGLNPVTLNPLRPARSDPHLSHGPHHAGSLHGALDPDPRRRSAKFTASGGQRRSIRATRLEKAINTPARIYYKYEGVSPAGSHKPNTAIAQAFYNKKAGIKRLATETGAGQWGSALSLACNCLRPGMHGLYGEGQLRTETLPPFAHAGLGWQGLGQPQPGHRSRTQDPGSRTPTAAAVWASPSARRWRMPPPTEIPITPWAVS